MVYFQFNASQQMQACQYRRSGTPSEGIGLPRGAKRWGFQMPKILAAGAPGLMHLWTDGPSALLQGKTGNALASSPESPSELPVGLMQHWHQPALDSLLADLPSVLQEPRQPAVVNKNARVGSAASWKPADCGNLSAAAPRVWPLLLPQLALLVMMLLDAQALGLLTAHRRACMHCWADHTPAQRTQRLH